MKIFKAITLVSTLALGALMLSSCGAKEKSNGYVDVQINPGVELVVNSDNVVVAANGTNDDGKTLLINVQLKGKTLEKSLEIVVDEAVSTGYISASTNAEQKEIKISVDAETDKAQVKLEATVQASVEKIIDEKDLNAAYKKLEAKGRAHLEAIVLAYNPALTQEEVSSMTNEQLMAQVELATIEKAQYASVELEKFYLEFKNYEFQMKYKKEILDGINKVNKVIGVAYEKAVASLEEAIKQIEELQYKTYVSEESDYLKLIDKLNSYKDQNVELKFQLINDTTGNNVTIQAQITANNQLIDAVTAQIQAAMDTYNASLEVIKLILNQAILSLDAIEKTVTNIDYEAILNTVESDINNTKNGLCASFEAKYADEIASIKAKVSERKTALQNKISAE